MISKEYKKELQKLHAVEKFAEINSWYIDVKNFIQDHKATTKSVLDFGCANGITVKNLRTDFTDLIIDGYDPAVPQFEIIPTNTYDLLISTDVLEHIEPQFLDPTLSLIESLYSKNAWFIIACYPAKKILSDGRNAHLIVESPDWWLKKITNIMKNSQIVQNRTVVLNPESDVFFKKRIIPKGEKIEIHLTLKKNEQV